MIKYRSILSILFLAMILPYQGIAPASALRSQLRVPEGSNNLSFVNLYIDQIEFLGKTGDTFGAGEFRLIILAADTTGKSSGMFCPSDTPLKVHKGDIVKAPCLLTVSFDESKVSDEVYLTIMAVDEDKSSLPADLSYEVATSTLGSAFGKAVKNGLVKAALVTAAKSTPFTFAAEVLFSLLSGKVKEWIEQPDTISSQGIYLSRKDNWAADKPTTVTLDDRRIRITYTVVRTTSTPPNPKAPVLGRTAPVPTPTAFVPAPTSSIPRATPRPALTSTPAVLTYWCDDLSYVKLKVGDRAKVVYSLKVNLRTAPVVPPAYFSNSIAKLEHGTALTVIGGPACAHNGTWWQVRTTKSGQTGWMREYIPGDYLLGR